MAFIFIEIFRNGAVVTFKKFNATRRAQGKTRKPPRFIC